VEAIPAELRGRAQWVAWRFAFRSGKWTKVPFDPRTRRAADATDPATWGTFAEAWGRYDAGGFDGVGYVFAADDPYAGVDLDGSLGDGGKTLEWAAPILERFAGAYAEVSPSGRGVKLFVRGRLPGKGKRKAYGGGAVEVYDRGRYFTVTGRRLDGSAAEVRDAQAALDWLLALVWPEKPKRKPPRPEGGPTPLTDEQIKAKLGRAANAAKFRALMAGDTGEYPSPSEADAGLCGIIAFYTDDAAQIERLFGESELARRGKWAERPDYRARTIAYVLSQKTERYDSTRGRHHSNGHAKTGKAEAPPPPPDEPGGPAAEHEAPPPDIFGTILAYWRDYYKPTFRRGNVIYSDSLRREVRPSEACFGAPAKLLAMIAHAHGAPRDRKGNLDRDALPRAFRNWASCAWAQLLLPLRDEEDAEEVSAPAGEDFRAAVAAVLYRIVTLGHTYRKGSAEETKIEHRSLIDWCVLFAKPGRWESVRSYKLWTRRPAEGEYPEVALNVGLFGQVPSGGLAKLKPKQFARQAGLYGVGAAGDDCRPCGARAVRLDPAFVAELLARPELPVAGETPSPAQGREETPDGSAKEEQEPCHATT
jgi:hypothetical protein